MTDAGLFTALAAVGISLAGFAGVIAALGRTPGGHAAVLAYRITNIVFLGLTRAMAAFGTLVAYTMADGDLALAVRVGTVLVLLPYLRGFDQLRPGPAWPDERQRRVGFGVLIGMLLLTAANIALASVGYLELLLLVALVVGPGLIFYNTIRDVARAERGAGEQQTASG
ncbi:MAG TPA: hypothetical protein VFP19_09730 [Candidatus Limnocylindrales bacterium]|nr:hypothetical protein [Candidatus Limnocylindrales bacterium]